MEITIKAIKTKAVLNFMIIGVSIKASTEVSINTSSILIENLLRS